jgi:hypothetical protein
MLNSMFASLMGKRFAGQKILLEVARRLRIGLLGHLPGALPARSIASIEASHYKPLLRRHVEKIEEVGNAQLARYSFPESYPAEFRREKVFERRLLFTVTDAVISPYSGLCWLPEKYLLQESGGSLEKILNWGGIQYEMLLASEGLQSRVPHLVVPSAPFYHFMWEHLTVILQTLTRYPDTRLILPEHTPAYVVQALDLTLGLDWQKKAIRVKQPQRAERLYLPSIEVNSGFIYPDYIRLLQERFAPLKEGIPAGQDMIYISRRYSTRKMAGERELEQALEGLGFKIVYAEKLTLGQQLQTFYRAGFVIAPHGAGLSHLQMCLPGTKLLEIFPHNYFNDCYARLAVACGLDYDYMTCLPSKTEWPGGIIPVQHVLEKASRMEVAQ